MALGGPPRNHKNLAANTIFTARIWVAIDLRPV
jgi:hypothetical protein